jgi:hypothetical protein
VYEVPTDIIMYIYIVQYDVAPFSGRRRLSVGRKFPAWL